MIEEIDGWPVVMDFDPSPTQAAVRLADITHLPKALLQGDLTVELGEMKPGQIKWTGRGYAALIKPQEAVVYDLTGEKSQFSARAYYTDMTEAWALFALWGPAALSVMQRLVGVDLERPRMGPFFLVTKLHALNLQILNPKGHTPGFLLGCTRSHAQNLFSTVNHVGLHLGLKLSGFKAFKQWLKEISQVSTLPLPK